jgi:hypothetical protein
MMIQAGALVQQAASLVLGGCRALGQFERRLSEADPVARLDRARLLTTMPKPPLLASGSRPHDGEQANEPAGDRIAPCDLELPRPVRMPMNLGFEDCMQFVGRQRGPNIRG